MGKDTTKSIPSFIGYKFCTVGYYFFTRMRQISMPTASHSMGLLRHYDRLLVEDLAYFINHLTLLTLVLQNNVLSATLT